MVLLAEIRREERTEVERCGGRESLLDGEGGFGLGGTELLRGGLWSLDCALKLVVGSL